MKPGGKRESRRSGQRSDNVTANERWFNRVCKKWKSVKFKSVILIRPNHSRQNKEWSG